MCFVTGFLKKRKKDRKKSSKSVKGEGDGDDKGMGSDGEEGGRSGTPTPDQVRRKVT